MSDASNCPACGVAYTEHLGLIGTCVKLQILRQALEWVECHTMDRDVEKVAQQALHRLGGEE